MHVIQENLQLFLKHHSRKNTIHWNHSNT